MDFMTHHHPIFTATVADPVVGLIGYLWFMFAFVSLLTSAYLAAVFLGPAVKTATRLKNERLWPF